MTGVFQYSIAVAGLFNAGKTSIIQRLITGKFIPVRPTRGVDTETVEKRNVKFLVFDLGGQEVFIHTIWKNFIRKADILIYVVDASDYSKFEKARDVLHMAISWNRDIPTLMILANKQDLSPAANEDQLMEKFELSRILGETSVRNFQIFGTSAKTGELIEEAFEWLATKLTGQGVPRAKIQSVVVYKKLEMPASLNQDPISEMFHINLSMDKNNAIVISDFFYNMVGQNAALIEQIKTLEFIGSSGNVFKLVNVGKENYYCLLIVDLHDHTPSVEAIGDELIDYLIEQERNKQNVDMERIHGILYPFLLKDEELRLLNEMRRSKEYKKRLPERKTVEEIIEQKEREFYKKEYMRRDIDFFTKLSIMDRIREIEERKRGKK